MFVFFCKCGGVAVDWVMRLQIWLGASTNRASLALDAGVCPTRRLQRLEPRVLTRAACQILIEGVLVTRPSIIFWHYASHWMLPDLLAAIR